MNITDPIAIAKVNATHTGTNTTTIRADSNGNSTITGLPQGDDRITFSATGHTTEHWNSQPTPPPPPHPPRPGDTHLDSNAALT